MTSSAIFLTILLIVMVVLFLTEKLPLDLTASLALAALIFSKLISPDEAFQGFSSPAVITLVSTFFLSAGFQSTGLGDRIGSALFRMSGSHQALAVAVMMIATALLSAFIPNVAATAIMMPAAAALAMAARLSPSALFLPLSFAALLGGMSTLIGTSSNILAAEAMRTAGLEPFHLFDFSLCGAVCAVAGILFVVFVGVRSYPHRIAPITRGQSLEEIYRVHEALFSISVLPGSLLRSHTLGSSNFGAHLKLGVVVILRDGRRIFAPDASEPIFERDVLIVRGDFDEAQRILEEDLAKESLFGEIVLDRNPPVTELNSKEISIVEVAVAPRSELAGKNLSEIHFRERFSVQVLAIWRNGQPLTKNLGTVKLEEGDALLLIGASAKIPKIASDRDLLLLSNSSRPSRREHRAIWVISAFLALVVLSALQIFPAHVVAFIAALIVILSGALTMEEAYRNIDWRMIVLIGALLPLAQALERSGLAAIIAGQTLALAHTPHLFLLTLLLLSSLLAQLLDGTVAVVILAPVALSAATLLNVAPEPLMMAVALGASVAFMTHFSHRAHILVMGAGGYKPSDYFKVGTPLSIILVLLLWWLIPIQFGW